MSSLSSTRAPRSIRRWVAVAGSLLATTVTWASEPARLPVEDFRILMVLAIDAPAGTAFGVLVGDMATALTQQLQASGPILIDVTTQRRLKQTGCSRLNVRFSQDGVHLPGQASPQMKTLDLGINYCRDGRPPRPPA